VLPALLSLLALLLLLLLLVPPVMLGVLGRLVLSSPRRQLWMRPMQLSTTVGSMLTKLLMQRLHVDAHSESGMLLLVSLLSCGIGVCALLLLLLVVVLWLEAAAVAAAAPAAGAAC
jgi:hypothetical protein